ncbi:MAG: UDP-N-acetylglucosamine 2-epimerase (non-hydrolyzing) [Gammaproteobacteria bacterium]|nr:UDP-N-acetylglucosamine 2-epimerase (non-hydrolyzing) [Gammaproteobacteria bacterium]HJP17156.1 UDP-N-acetylglucosamine 2-epimerase (non-hydrolyzing) [Nitrospinota bacterium]|tara:strand:+ start:6925 stop:8037 length:1113 start_codon:yes stop_codon:yes gene_type:complete
MKVFLVVGGRPNFMKVAPIYKEMKKYPSCFKHVIVHTGQHYDKNMSSIFFKNLGLHSPDIFLGVSAGNHGQQTGRIMIEFEKQLLKEKPGLVIVVGDVNSTLACSIASVKLGIVVAHVESGLRSFDRTMPEEINRIVTDSVSDILFTTSKEAKENLLKEGIPENKIYFVGNVMIDSLYKIKSMANKSGILRKLGITNKNYITLTLHRPSNVDYKNKLVNILDAIKIIQQKIKVVFPVHPRTDKMLKKFRLMGYMNNMKNVTLIEPLGYLDFTKLMVSSKIILTDSGGIQEETTILNVPCLTLRENTERPITVAEGTNELVGNNTKKIISSTMGVLNYDGNYKSSRAPRYWDGKASKRIVKVLKNKINLID